MTIRRATCVVVVQTAEVRELDVHAAAGRWLAILFGYSHLPADFNPENVYPEGIVPADAMAVTHQQLRRRQFEAVRQTRTLHDPSRDARSPVHEFAETALERRSTSKPYVRWRRRLREHHVNQAAQNSR